MLYLDCSLLAPSQHGNTQQWPLPPEIPEIISPSLLMPTLTNAGAWAGTTMTLAGQMVAIGPSWPAEHLLHWPSHICEPIPHNIVQQYRTMLTILPLL
jgi:hypothetical protein